MCAGNNENNLNNYMNGANTAADVLLKIKSLFLGNSKSYKSMELEAAQQIYDAVMNSDIDYNDKVVAIAGISELLKEAKKKEDLAFETRRILADVDLCNKILNKCENIPEGRRTKPTNKTMSILKDAELCLDNDEIKEMFANLISKSLDASYEEHVIPAFSNIIKQLSPNDAIVLKEIYKTYLKALSSTSQEEHVGSITTYCRITDNGEDQITKFSNPKGLIRLANITFINESDGSALTYNGVLNIEDMSIDNISLSVDNLMRCNLIFSQNSRDSQICFEKIFSPGELKSWSCTSELLNNGYMIAESGAYTVTLSELGKKFYLICCEDTK